MDIEPTTDKLKHVTVGNQKGAVKPMSPAERQEEIDYLRGLFWLSFRVYDGDLKLPDDGVVDLHEGETAGYGEINEDELNGFRQKFAALDALDVFYKLCLDYCQDQLAVLKKRGVQIWEILDKYAKNDPNTVAQMSRKSRRRYEYLYKFYKDRADYNYYDQKELKAQIKTLKQKLAELAPSTQPNHMQKGAPQKSSRRQAFAAQNSVRQDEVAPTIER